MIYGSVCSGIEAATVAWHPLEWKPAWFSEIEKFPSAVLEHHYPHVENRGDMTKFKEWNNGAIDLLVGGTPCQSYSVAGLRKGLADPRGNLMLTYLAIAAKYRPTWLVWENVPGVLSSNGGRDFGTFLGMLAELGYGFAYRVLDAQYFGLAQRRKRVFVIGHIGDWRRAAAVLFERHSLSGDIAPSRKAGQAVAALTANGVGTCGADDNQGQTGHLIPFDYQSSGEYGGGQVSVTLSARDYKSAKDLCVSITGEITHALNTANNGKGRSEDGTGRGVPTIAHSMVPYEQQGRRVQSERFVAPTLMSNPAGGVKLEPVLDERLLIVRRLTPVECERLQGFEDDYTLIPWRGKNANQCPDGPRYKSLGNSMAVPVMHWIGSRIKQVEAMRSVA